MFLSNFDNHLADSKYHNPEHHNTIATIVKALNLVHIDAYCPSHPRQKRTIVTDVHTDFKLHEHYA
jgi:hypothetical protein